MNLIDNAQKYVNYVFDTHSFRPAAECAQASESALAAAQQIRGVGRPPALIVHGLMPRTGTVYMGELLGLHPDLYAYPNRIWEAPFLQLTPDVEELQAKFLRAYRHNVGKLANGDFLAVFGAAMIGYLYSFVPEGRRMLLKVPGVQYLDHFYTMFPHEHLLLLARDGRDVVESTLKTWPQLQFSVVARRWMRSARMALHCHTRYAARSEGYWFGRFEDAIRDPAAFVVEVCRHLDLDANRYPFDQIETISIRGSSALKSDGKVVWDPVARPQSFNPTERWRSWTSGRKRSFKRIAGQALLDLGYGEDLNW